jgi:hypothetical protein
MKLARLFFHKYSHENKLFKLISIIQYIELGQKKSIERVKSEFIMQNAGFLLDTTVYI